METGLALQNKYNCLENFQITNRNHKSLDGIRAIGILMVLFKHFYGALLNVSFFWTSIDLLFALSGLLITGILIETKNSPNYFKNFYIRRALRIFPLYYLLIFIFLFYILFITNSPQSLKYFTNNIGYFLFYCQNWYFINYGIPDGGHLNHTWSLAVDEQIYILWPLLIFLCKNKSQLIWLCITTILFSLFFRLWYINFYLSSVPLDPYAAFHNTFCRIDSFAAGSLLYCLMRFNVFFLNTKNALILFFATIFLVIIIGLKDNNFNFTGYYMNSYGFTLMGLNFMTWIYFSFTTKNKFLIFILQNSLLRYIGKISYSLYVFHWFILMLLLPTFNIFFKRILNQNSNFLSITFCVVTTFVISALSYKYFEKPIIKLKKKFV